MDERIDEREIICVICPNSCRLTVWRDKEGLVKVSGNQCSRGVVYGTDEYTHPVRMLITTMRIEDGTLPVIPIRSFKPIPKQNLLQAVRVINDLSCKAPITMGDVLVKNILGTGIDVIASRSMDKIDMISDIEKASAELDLTNTVKQALMETVYNGKDALTEEEKQKLQKAEKTLVKKLKKFGLKEI